jgi:hypothetical protein
VAYLLSGTSAAGICFSGGVLRGTNVDKRRSVF